MNLVVQWYKRDVRKQRFQVQYWVVSYISSFFFNLVEKNLLRVKKFSKCRENGIACLRKGKLRRRQNLRAAIFRPPAKRIQIKLYEPHLGKEKPVMGNIEPLLGIT